VVAIAVELAAGLRRLRGRGLEFAQRPAHLRRHARRVAPPQLTDLEAPDPGGRDLVDVQIADARPRGTRSAVVEQRLDRIRPPLGPNFDAPVGAIARPAGNAERVYRI